MHGETNMQTDKQPHHLQSVFANGAKKSYTQTSHTCPLPNPYQLNVSHFYNLFYV